ncbi:Serine/threonine-protein kinase PknB [Rubripirellula amarantea]|uniref:Serine/threonine-protein kinase PknB n=1 Tax=Rubripirellula amarantea TaxID=2527999 RepID=A0A5C5WVY7_9BACT|nr:serine/threonine-protein kinase [Rubripirellula amarantea]TWT54730.1 Serine/threonine-protein kinase PknB [Rubripirellula amarantea]
MSLFDSLKSAFKSSGGAKTTGRIDVEGRFHRTRTAFTGTMANFFVAKDRMHNDRMVGVKILDIEKYELFEARFKGLNKPTEGQIAMLMKHPKVVETYEIGVSPKGEPVIVMEYIGGPSLQNIVVQKQEHHVTGKRLRMIRDMAEALKYVHDQGFIHRDICPRNFICTPDNTLTKLIDFGLTVPATAPFMVSGNRTGTPLYMSPEIVRRRPTDKRVDVFSFGVTCFCLVAFEHPWQSEMLNGRAALQHDTADSKQLVDLCPTVDPRLAKAIMHALNPNVDDRTASMDMFLHSIRDVKQTFTDKPEVS